jgi:hypothetical protein
MYVDPMETIILDFWKCSLSNNFENFDWTEAFDTYIPYLERNCIEHGQGSYEDYKENMEELYGDLTLELPDWCKYNTLWGSFDENDAVDALLRAKYEFMRDNFSSNVHGDNAELLYRAKNHSFVNDLPKLIELFDECIHAQHATGNILEDVDVDELREQAEEEWKEEQEDKTRFATNIRDFL